VRYLLVLLGESTVRRYEANPIDGDEVCFMFSKATLLGENFIVSYNITSDEIPVRMNLRSTANNRILLSRLLPVRFRQWYENGKNLTEPYEIEFCASSEMLSDDTDGPTSASAVIVDVKYVITSDGRYLSLCVAKLIS